MTDLTMTRHNSAENPQSFAEIRQWRRNRFVKVCLNWPSARALADDLASIGYPVSERTCTNWRNRTFSRLEDDAVQAVKLAAQYRKLNEANAHAQHLQELAAL